MAALKKIWKFLSSMQFAVVLLVILAVACAGGSFIPQGLELAEYASADSERTASLIVALGMDDVFHCWWFITLAVFLCGNLILCNLIRLPGLIKRTKRSGGKTILGEPTAAAEHVTDPKPFFERFGITPKEEKDEDGRAVLYGDRHRAGIWGAWVCHLGVLLLILGFGLGQMTHREYSVYGVKGESLPVGDTGLVMTIDDYRVVLREDDTVSQYTAELTLTDTAKGLTESGTAEVNRPAELLGYRCYQNSTGWAATVTVTKAGSLLQEEVLCAGEFLPVLDLPELVVLFNAFYPDYVLTDEGPATASGSIRNPGYLYSLYYLDPTTQEEHMLGMNVLLAAEQITVDDYVITFSEPQNYTLIQIKKDQFTWLAFLGGLIVLCGLVLALYLQPMRLSASRDEDGTWTVKGECRKTAPIFREQFEEISGVTSPREPDTVQQQEKETNTDDEC